MKPKLLPFLASSTRVCASFLPVTAFGALAVLCSSAAWAADGTWTNTAGGNWSLADTANWSGGTVADGSGFTGNFNTLNITADTTVALTEDRVIGNLTFGDTTASSAAGWILNGAGKLTLAVSSGAPTITVNALGTGKNVAIANVLDGTAGLTKAGTGSLSLGGVSTYTGTTTISDGTLILSSGNNRLPTSSYVLFSSAAGVATSRTLALGSTSQEFGRLNVSYNPNGAVTHSALVTGATGSLKVSGAFDLNVTNSSSVTPATTPSVVHLDLSGLGTFEYNSATKKVIVFGNGNARTGTLSLGGTNTLTALSLDLQNGGVGSNTAKTSFLNLGQTNTINADTITVLNDNTRDGGTVQFRTGLAAGPTLKIRGTAGADSNRTNISIATNTQSTNQATGTGSIDLATGTTTSSLDAMVGTLQLGSKTAGTTTHSAVFSMRSGTLDATTINLGTLSSSGGLNSTLTVAGGTVKVSTLNFGSRTNGTLTSTLNLNSAGTLAAQTVANSGTATRTLNWNDGTISNYDSATDLAFASGVNVKLAATGTHAFDVGTGRSSSISSVLADATTGGTLSKIGQGTLTLSAANTYSGNTTVNAGTLQLGSTGQLKFVLGATSGSNNSISGAGTVTLDGSFAIDRTAALALTSGTWTLVNVTSLTGAYGSTFTVAGFTDIGGDQWRLTEGAKQWTFSETTGALTLVTLSANLNWSGAVDGNWDIGTTSNWLNGVSTSTYAVGDHARFDDAATGTTNVVLDAAITPETVVFDNTSKNYTLTGTGSIGGFGTLTKSGTGTVVIATDNTYSGGSTINAGTLKIGDGGITGSLGTGAITNNGTLTIDRSDNLVLPALSGTGNLIQLGSGLTILGANNSYSGTTTISNGTLQIGNGGTTGSLGSTSAIVNNGVLAYNRTDSTTISLDISGSGELVKSGSGTLVLDNDMTFTGGTTITAGSLQLGTGGTTGSVVNASIFNDGNLIVKHSDDLDFSTNISGGGSVTHAGSGLLRLTGSNSYYGNTIIAGTGTLRLDSLGSSLPSGTGISFTGGGSLDVGDTSPTINSLSKAAGVSVSVVADAGKSLTVSGTGNVLVNDGSLGLSILDGFVYENAAGTFNTSVVNTGGTASTTLAYLTNSITASNFNVGVNGPAGSGTSSSATVNLGKTNTINANTIVIGTNGAQSGTSTLRLLSGFDTPPSVVIRGTSGGSSRANITVGYKNTSDYAGGSGIVDFTSAGSTLDAMVGTLTLGKHDTGAGNFNNATSGSFSFNEGTLDATSIVMAVAATVNLKTADGTLTTNGGTIKVGTLTLVQDSGGATGTATVNLNGAATLSAATITGQAAANAVINWNAGTLSNLPDTNLTATAVSLKLPSGTATRTLSTSGANTASLASTTILATRFNSSAGTPVLGGFTLSGTLNLGNAILTLTDEASSPVALAGGTKLTLIDYTGSTLSGTFAGMAEGAQITVGPNTFTVSYADASKVTLTVPAGYTSWATANAGGEAADLDHDHDGVPNGVEYFMGQTGSSFTTNPSLVGGSVTWPKDPTASATYVVQTSTNLSSWTTATSGVVDNGTSVTYTIPTGDAARFSRIKVTIP